MSENRRYYWLKLQETFFEDDTIDFIESQENGEKYVVFYLKLCLKALKNEGKLIRYVGELLMPYDEVGIAKLTKTDIDTVRSALILFTNIGLIKRLESGEIYLTQLDELIGTETSAAQRKRKQRINEKMKLECDNVTPMSQIGHTDIDIEIDKDKELDKDISKKATAKADKFSEEDYKRCMNIYYENRSELSKFHEVINIKYSPKSYRGIIKPFFVEYGVETVLQAVRNSVNHYWAKTTDYSLGVIFNYKKFDEYVSGYAGASTNNKSTNNTNFDKRKLDDKYDLDAEY